ncbi:related to conserved oligomeric Golgi complex component 3 [Phialocephala subalpina]|uniref:Conserved oligomeric Golgi complex subunit 3 n=1 Tax=Phialocephala subalpina TaxID=576137 RepID=A0A1L7WXP0_9HELO|nr:related to conserved oligomeric Golgi complex component 3 [Phialocephala subalpina]
MKIPGTAMYPTLTPRVIPRPHNLQSTSVESLCSSKQMSGSNSNIGHGPMMGIYEDATGIKNPPQATLSRRAKSYSDFYDVAMSFLSKDAQTKAPPDVLEVSEEKLDAVNLTAWYEDVDDELLDESQEEYQLYRDQLALSERHLNTLLKDTTDALDLLASLSQSFKAVESETTAFQAQCEDLLAEQQRLRSLADEVGTDLQYYAYLEPLTRRLNTPGAGRLVRSDDFLNMLMNLNTCIDFMDQHPNYRDSTVYKTRYISLLERSLNIVQTAFSSAMKEVTDEVTKELRSKDHNETAEYILTHGRYETVYDNLGSQVEKLLTTREFAFGQAGSDEPLGPQVTRFHELYFQLIESYLRSREPVAIVVSKNLKKYVTNEKPETEFESFARLCIQHILDVCHNEQKLVTKFFHDGPLLADYGSLEGWNKSTQYGGRLEDNILSHLEPLNTTLVPYLSTGGVEKICGIVNWLETMYMSSSDGDLDDYSHNDKKPIAQAFLVRHLYKLLDSLFLKTAAEISQFKPTPEDLRLAINAAPLAGGKKKPMTSNGQPDDEKPPTPTAQGPASSYTYPTVQTAIKLLVMYHEGTYDRPRNSDVLYEIVHQATMSLQKAATTIMRTSGIMDAQLFLIKNLMLIENLFMTKEIPDSIRHSTEFDFTPIWDTMRELQDRKQLYNPTAYISPFIKGKLLPAVVDRMLDARKELEKVLVQQITAFTKTWQTRLADTKNRETMEKELDTLLNKVFDDETTRAALWKMIRADE